MFEKHLILLKLDNESVSACFCKEEWQDLNNEIHVGLLKSQNIVEVEKLVLLK